MLLDCPACASSYHVSRADIGEEGRAVICPRCEARWFVQCDAYGTLVPVNDLRTTSISRRPDSVARTAERAPLRRRLAPAVAIAACVVATMGLLGARERIVAAAPRLAGLYAAIGLPVNVRGLEILALSPARPASAPGDVTIAGEIRNVAKKRVGVPRVTYQIRDAHGATLATWTEHAPARTLGVGKSLPFVSTPHTVPPGAAAVLVRFEDDMPVRVAGRLPE